MKKWREFSQLVTRRAELSWKPVGDKFNIAIGRSSGSEVPIGTRRKRDFEVYHRTQAKWIEFEMTAFRPRFVWISADIIPIPENWKPYLFTIFGQRIMTRGGVLYRRESVHGSRNRLRPCWRWIRHNSVHSDVCVCGMNNIKLSKFLSSFLLFGRQRKYPTDPTLAMKSLGLWRSPRSVEIGCWKACEERDFSWIFCYEQAGMLNQGLIHGHHQHTAAALHKLKACY